MHSPLGAEVSESLSRPDDNSGQAQPLGNLLTSDRGALSVAGTQNGNADVDWYQFTVGFEAIQGLSHPYSLSTIFDIDYASGLFALDTNLSVYYQNPLDGTIRLIFYSGNSNVNEDQPNPGPLKGDNINDLSRGSVGTGDPYIGMQSLVEGTYYVAVSSGARLPQQLKQFSNANAANKLVRLDPITALQRIVDDTITGPMRVEATTSGATVAPPVVPDFINADSVTPFNLGDVSLFVSADTGATDRTRISTVDPFTGQQLTTVGVFTRDVGDIAMNRQGNLYAYSTDRERPANDNPNDANSGNLLQIDTGTGAATVIRDDGIQTYEPDPDDPTQSLVTHPVPPPDGTRVGDGIQFDATTFGVVAGAYDLFGVGSRGFNVNNNTGADYTDNILYQMVANEGAGNFGVAFSSPQGDRGNVRYTGAGTQIRERGFLDTTVDAIAAGGNTVIVAAPATDAATPDPDIMDTTRFVIDNGGPVTFEFDSGPQGTLNINPGSATGFIHDGDTIRFDGPGGPLVEFDTGAVLVVSGGANAGQGYRDGDTITITNGFGNTHVFEFDMNGMLNTGGATAIPFTFSFTNANMAAAIAAAVNGLAGFGVTVSSLPGNINRLSIVGDTSTTIDTSMGTTNLARDGAAGLNNAGAAAVQVEETSTIGEVLAALSAATYPAATIAGVAPNITAGVVGINATRGRVNFSGAMTIDSTSFTNAGVFTATADMGGVNAGADIAVPFLINDNAMEIAQRINTILVAEGYLTQLNQRTVEIVGGPTVTSVDSPLQLGGAAPGGTITGIAIVGGHTYVVSDTGGLFEVINSSGSAPFNPAGTGAKLDYINTATSLVGLHFQGLAAGPANVEGGRYADTLFAIDDNARLYAFDTQGFLQPIFVDGNTNVDTGLTGQINGLAFSNLDYNLWHVTNGVGPGNNPGSQPNSLYFGYESRTANNIDTTTSSILNPSNRVDNFDFGGGAYGSVESAAFSLAGYSPQDEPTLYFDYFLDTQDKEGNALPTISNAALDTFRVFVGTSDGKWYLVATNNAPDGGANQVVSTITEFDNSGSWRQVRVPLGAFAGLSDLKMRVDFSSAGSMNLGGTFTTGDELRANPAAKSATATRSPSTASPMNSTWATRWTCLQGRPSTTARRSRSTPDRDR